VRAQSLVAHLAAFCRALRGLGIGVVLSDTVDGTAALRLVDLADRAEVRDALRIGLKIRMRDRERFDRLFDEWWREDIASAPPRQKARKEAVARGIPIRLSALARQAVELPSRELETPEGGTPGYSSHPLLKRKSFDEWSEDDLARMEAVMARLAVKLATRRSRRLVPVRGRGLVDLRRSLRGSLATSGELLSLARKDRPIERPRLVLLCDTSGSMDPYTRFLLAFVLSLGRVIRVPEVFVFNTVLTRLTRWVSSARVRETLDRLAAEVPDWSGGTRIGECLHTFAREYLSSLVNSKTVVVILSDGLDRGDPETLRSAMHAIHRAARKVIWLNPLMGDPRYQPTARGMQAAVPFIDHLAPAHNLESLAAIVPSLAA